MSRTGNPPISNGVHSWNSCGHFQFLCGCDAADAPLPGNGLPANHERDVRAIVVVCPSPLRGEVLGLPLAGRRLPAIAVRLDVFDDVLVEPLMPE